MSMAHLRPLFQDRQQSFDDARDCLLQFAVRFGVVNFKSHAVNDDDNARLFFFIHNLHKSKPAQHR